MEVRPISFRQIGVRNSALRDSTALSLREPWPVAWRGEDLFEIARAGLCLCFHGHPCTIRGRCV